MHTRERRRERNENDLAVHGVAHRRLPPRLCRSSPPCTHSSSFVSDMGEGDFSLRANTTVEGQGAAAATAAYLSKALGLKEGAPRGPRIRLALVSETIVPGREDYRLAVARNVVRIEASHPEGLFYGAQTLLQLVANTLKRARTIPAVRIHDFPPLSLARPADRRKPPLLRQAHHVAHHRRDGGLQA